MHFCTLTARSYGGVCWPRKYGMNGTIPATVNNSDGSGETSDAEGTTVGSCFSKKAVQRRAISCVCITVYPSRARTGSTPVEFKCSKICGLGGAIRGYVRDFALQRLRVVDVFHDRWGWLRSIEGGNLIANGSEKRSSRFHDNTCRPFTDTASDVFGC